MATDYLANKVILITGASSGFGKEAAKQLLARRARVVITGRDAGRLAAAAKELAGGPNLLAVVADATLTADWDKVLAQTVARFGRLDVLVNNHGAGVKIAPVAEQDDAAIEAALAINLTSVIKGCRAAVKVMQPQACGQIINVSSACAYHSWGNWGVYTAAKAGMVAFTKCLAVEMAQWGGRATSFIPGAARTNFAQAAGIDSSWQEGYPSSEEFVRALVHCIDQPENTVIEELNVWGVRQIKDMMNPF